MNAIYFIKVLKTGVKGDIYELGTKSGKNLSSSEDP